MKIFRRLYSEPQNGNQKSRGSRGGKNRGGGRNKGGNNKPNNVPTKKRYVAPGNKIVDAESLEKSINEYLTNEKAKDTAKAAEEAAKKLSKQKNMRRLKIGGAVVLGTGLVAGGAYAGKKLYDKHQEKKANEAVRRKIFPGESKKKEQEEND